MSSPSQSLRLPLHISAYITNNRGLDRLNYWYQTYLEGFKREGSSEVGMGVLRIFLDHDIEVLHSLLILLNHLKGFSTLMDVSQVTWNSLDTLSEGEY